MEIKKYTLQPHVGIGPIKFGMTKSEVRNILDQTYTWMKAERNTYFEGYYQPQRDYFTTDGIKVEYDEKDRCTFIEVGANIELSYNEIYFFRLTCEELINNLQQKDPELAVNSGCIVSPASGISITFSDCPDFRVIPPELVALSANEKT